MDLDFINNVLLKTRELPRGAKLSFNLTDSEESFGSLLRAKLEYGGSTLHGVCYVLGNNTKSPVILTKHIKEILEAFIRNLKE